LFREFADDVLRRPTLPGKQNIRLNECQQLLIDDERISNDRQGSNSFRVVTVSADAHQRVAGASGEYQLRKMRRQRDNTKSL
jgi:hypothetical protein